MNVTATAYKMIRHIVAPSLSVLVGTWLLLCASLVPAHAQLSGAVTDQFRAAMQDCGSGLPCLNAMMVASAVPLTTTQSLNQLFLGAFQSCGGVPCLTITNAAGSGMVTTSGAPVAGQTAEFTSATAITGVATTGTGSYVKNTSPSLLGTTTATRVSFTGAPVYDLGFGILAVSVPIPLDTADHTIPASDAFDHVRISQTTGANNTFTVGANATVTGYRALLTLNSGSDSTAAMYGGAFGITNAGPGSAKAVHGAVAGSGASTGVLVAFNAQIQPVATQNSLSSAVQVSLTSAVGAHDVVTGMNIGSSGDRFLYGIGSPGGAVPYGKAAFHAWMATGSSAGADFLRLDNNAGTTIYHVDKSGNGFAQQISLRDTSAAFDVTLAAVSSVALTAGRVLTLDMGNVAHTLAFGTTANTITFPSVASDTVALLGVANVFTKGLGVEIAGLGGPYATTSGSAVQAGEKLVMYSTANYRVAIGMGNNGVWIQNTDNGGGSSDGINLYGGTGTAAVQIARFSTNGNLELNAFTVGTNLAKGILMGTGTAPSTSPATAIQLWAANWNGANTAALNLRVEEGTVHTFGSTVTLGGPLTTAGTVAITGGLTTTTSVLNFPGLGTSSAATTGTLCWTTGTGLVNVDTTVACLASTLRVKEHVVDLEASLPTVLALRPIAYDLKPEFNPEHLGRMVGLGAEDVYQIDPRLVALDADGMPRGVRYMQLTAVLVKSIQELAQEVRELQRHVTP